MRGRTYSDLADAQRRGVLDTINQMELWAVFGSRRDFLDAPAELVQRVMLALEGKGQAAEEQARESEREMERAKSGTSGGTGTGRTTVSRSG